ncbi:hypothetical protein [Paracoccus fontiphilus]|uniref:Uncharacterized protein n=2 Tax=Paracoccus fontiphilus TaxID=1815556 RepID=A0ABV7IH71_9RHOB|nr:hypothetical protein [Paracoccus fontiphilus]
MITADAAAKLIAVFAPGAVAVSLTEATAITKQYCEDLKKQPNVWSGKRDVTVVYKDSEGQDIAITATPVSPGSTGTDQVLE